MREPLVVVVHGHAQGAFGLLLADDEVVEVGLDFGGTAQGEVQGRLGGTFGGGFFQHDGLGLLHTAVTDVARGAGNQNVDLVLASSAKRAPNVIFGHGSSVVLLGR